jgi:hypothetical protein
MNLKLFAVRRSPDSRSFLKTASAVVGGKVNVRLRLPVGFLRFSL